MQDIFCPIQNFLMKNGFWIAQQKGCKMDTEKKHIILSAQGRSKDILLCLLLLQKRWV